jgi:hypothetical protein
MEIAEHVVELDPMEGYRVTACDACMCKEIHKPSPVYQGFFMKSITNLRQIKSSSSFVYAFTLMVNFPAKMETHVTDCQDREMDIMQLTFGYFLRQRNSLFKDVIAWFYGALDGSIGFATITKHVHENGPWISMESKLTLHRKYQMSSSTV